MSNLIWTPTSERLAGLDWYTVNRHGLDTLSAMRSVRAHMENVAFPGVLFRGGESAITTLLSVAPVEGVSKFKLHPATHYLPPALDDLRGVVYQYAFYSRYLRQVTKEGRLLDA